MNAAHLHLIVNHVPVFSLLIGLVVLGVGLLRKAEALKLAGLALIIVATAATPPVNSTGEEAQEIVEVVPNRSHDLIYAHEEAAETALWLMLLCGSLAIGAVVMLRRSHQRAHLLTSVTLGVGTLVFIWMMQVANLGGRISHPEIRPGYQVPAEVSREGKTSGDREPAYEESETEWDND